jgi:hypothetical protein
MAVISGRLFFAPGLQMKDVDLDDPPALVAAFERRVDGFFLSPVRALAKCGDAQEGALFASALLVAALVESVARVDIDRNTDEELIKRWLEARMPPFRGTVTIDGQVFTLGAVFEQRFRNGLAHNGYVASLGRLSGEIPESVCAVGPIVTVNPFAMAEAVGESFRTFAEELRTGVRDIRRFAYLVREQFQPEVESARREGAA